MPQLKVHPSNLIYFAICMLGIIAFFFIGIYPNLSTLKSIDEDISGLKQKAETQALLYPVYLKLLQEITQKAPTTFSAPEKKKISHKQLSQINDLFRQLATQSKITFNSAIPDASNYLEDMAYFTMNVDFSGDFFNLRELLIGICQMPFLESIDTMRIETINQEKRISFKIKLEQE
jgi:hypothetical protein